MTDDPNQSKGAAQAPTDEREAFENAVRAGKHHFPAELNRRDAKGSDRLGEYCRYEVEFAWRLWQDRAALASRTDGAAASVQKPALGHQIGASAEKSEPQFLGHPTSRSVEIPAAAIEDHADARRLDWLGVQWADGVHVEVCGKGNGSTWHAVRPAASVFVGATTHEGATLREAIDAAMKVKP